jgi:hypothetical protein
MMMNMADKLFQVENIKVSELEEYMNDLAEEGRALYNVFPLQAQGAHWFTVISYVPYNWEAVEARDTQKWKAELEAEKESAKHWAAKLAEKSGGHSNE